MKSPRLRVRKIVAHKAHELTIKNRENINLEGDYRLSIMIEIMSWCNSH